MNYLSTIAERQLAKEQQLEPVERHSAQSNRYFSTEPAEISAGIEDGHIPFQDKGRCDWCQEKRKMPLTNTAKETAVVMYIVLQYGN